MASSSNSNFRVATSGSIAINVSTIGAVTSGIGTPTVLSSAQASQLLSKLRTSGTLPQGIKIQAVQTNPHTGAKQIVAIPVQSSQGGKVNLSPVKVIRMPVSVAGGGTHYAQVVTSSVPGQNLNQSVQVVKLAQSQVPVSLGQQTTGHQVQSNSTNAGSHTVVLSNSSSARSLTNPGSQDTFGDSRIKRAAEIDFDSFSSEAKRRKTEKGGKGLRHFSMKVCEKVQAKGSTSYNEVADELVNELTDPRCASPTDQQYDQKNIRRRVYDALNVLMAMNIISKEKKEIRWLGLPTNSVQEANKLEQDKIHRIERIKAKTHQLQDLILQLIAFKNLVERNRDREKKEGAPAPNSAIQLPFIIVNTSKKTVIDCSISNDKMEYLFNFDDTFELHDDMEVLKRMGLSFALERGHVKDEELAKARTMVPKALEQYVVDLAHNGLGSCRGIPRVSSPKILKQEPVDVENQGGHSEPESTESDVDIN